MNLIKYINPRTGERKNVRVSQTPWWKIEKSYAYLPRHGSMQQVDALMHKQGFVRAGLRWRGAAARSALKRDALHA